MTLPYINPKLTNIHRELSRSTSLNKYKSSNPLPLLIQLCIHPNEDYACHTMRLLLSSRYYYSPNVCDDFGCNVLMYSLRYQRYRLFEYLLNEIAGDINLRAKDRQGNTILHYAILYSGNGDDVIDKLVRKYNKFAIEIDERNNLGFSPSLLAVFCGRYDLVLTLLTKTDASPFVRDYIQLKNVFDYVNFDVKHRESINQSPDSQQSSYANAELKCFRTQLQQTIPSRQEISTRTMHKNFFQTALFPVVQDTSGLLRSSIIELFEFKYQSFSLTNLLNYLNQRYPRIKTSLLRKDLQGINITEKLILNGENSKTDVHNMLNLFDPNLRSTVIPLPPRKIPPTTRAPIKFKRLGNKMTTLTALSRTQVGKQRPSVTVNSTK